MEQQALTPPPIGQSWIGQGGIYAGIIRGENGHPDHHLIIAPDEEKALEFGSYGKDTTNATSALDGFANTQALITSEHPHPAAEWANKYTADGRTDYYLPSRHELRLAYINALETFNTEATYWSSTQDSAHTAWAQYFRYGTQGSNLKHDRLHVRPVRRIQLNPSPL